MSAVLTATKRALGWMAGVLCVGVGILAVLFVVSPALYWLLSPLYEDSAAPILSLPTVDAVVALASMSVATAAVLGASFAFRIPVTRTLVSVTIAVLLPLGWTAALNGVDLVLLALLAGASLGVVLALGLRGLKRRGPLERASA